MASFLEKTARYIHDHLQEELADILVLVPNKRTAIFLEKEIARLFHEPSLMPKMVTIEEFIDEHSMYALADPLELKVLLYKVFTGHLPIYESFDQFYYWGDMLLNDFNDIDKNQVKPAEIFSLIQDEKEIEKQFQYLSPEQIEVIQKFWASFTPPNYEGNQQEFIDTWKALQIIYTDFRELLAAEGKAYSGMMFKEVSEKIQDTSYTLPYTKILFTGFHILSSSEEKIFNFFRKNKKGLFFWDVDEYYLDLEYSTVKNHEAGNFLRPYTKAYPNAITSSDMVKKGPEIHLVACPKNHGQAMAVREIIQREDIPYNEKTAVVLPEESMLLPVLQSVSETGKAINVTLGYSLKNSNIMSMIENWLDIFKYKTKDRFYYKPIIKFLNAAYIHVLYGDKAEKFQQYIIAHNLVYLYPDDLAPHDFLQPLLNADMNSSSRIIGQILDMTEKIYYHYFDLEEKTSSQVFETELLYQSFSALRKLHSIVSEYALNLQPDTLKKLLYKYLGEVQVNFSGEPVTGLQVMGLLESRNLDFDHVFILNANEGILPTSVSSGSYIPYHLRMGFGLPTFKNNDSMYAYYIYRLLHKAKNVYFIYNNVSDEGTRAEPSRYITQLKSESPFTIHSYTQKIAFTTPVVLPITVEKTADVTEKLKIYYEEEKEDQTYLTPSALNTYLDCSLKFYFRYIAGIHEPDRITEEVDAATFGNLLHHTMQYIYENFISVTQKSIIEAGDIPLLNSLIDGAIRQALKKEFSHPDKPREVELAGDYYIIYHIIEKYAENILRMDEQNLPRPVPRMEEKYVFGLPVQIQGKPEKLRIGGRLDRIDIKGDEVKIIDYKTGKSDGKNIFSAMEELFDRGLKRRKDYVFQIFLYAYLLEMNEHPGKKVVPQLLFIRDIYQKDFDAFIRYKAGKQELHPVTDILSFANEFRQGLDGLLQEFFDPAVPYTQTIHEEKCQYCPYVDICQRRQ